MFGLSKYLVGGVGIALALSLAWGVRVNSLRADWKDKYENLSVVAGKILVSIRLASDNPKLGLNDAAEQVDIISESRKAWRDASHMQTRRIDELGVETARLKALSDEARRKADAAIAKREKAIDRLKTLALTPGERADCAKQIQQANEALDLVYSEGL